MINSQINVLAQAKSYLQSVSPALYTQIVNPQFTSSAGAHVRHILDHYQAIIDGLETGCIDYDKRTRGGAIESDINVALALISSIDTFLSSLSTQQLQKKLKLSTEVCVVKKRVEIVDTTIARELIFVGSHAIHHFAMIDQICKAQKLPAPDSFGIAPATATFLRDDEKSKQESDLQMSEQQCAH